MLGSISWRKITYSGEVRKISEAEESGVALGENIFFLSTKEGAQISVGKAEQFVIGGRKKGFLKGRMPWGGEKMQFGKKLRKRRGWLNGEMPKIPCRVWAEKKGYAGEKDRVPAKKKRKKVKLITGLREADVGQA